MSVEGEEDVRFVRLRIIPRFNNILKIQQRRLLRYGDDFLTGASH